MPGYNPYAAVPAAKSPLAQPPGNPPLPGDAGEVAAQDNPYASLTPATAPVVDDNPYAGLTQAPTPEEADDNPYSLTLSDGTTFTPEWTTAPKDVSSDTFLTVATGVSGTGVGAPAEARGIDLQATISVVAGKYILPKLLDDLQDQYPEGVPDNVHNALQSRAYKAARQDVMRAYKRTRGIDEGPLGATLLKGVDTDERPYVPLIDEDPSDTHQALKQWKNGELDYGGYLDVLPAAAREALAPFIAASVGTAVDIHDPEDVRSYNEGLNWGGLDWLGRLSVVTAASQYMAVNGDADWGGDEHLRNIQRGDDVFTLWDRLEDLAYREDVAWPRRLTGIATVLTSAVPGKAIEALDAVSEGTIGYDLATPEGAEKAGDFIAAFALSLVDPDVVGSIGVPLASASVRGAAKKLGSKVSSLRFGYKAQVYQESADALLTKVNTKVTTGEEFTEEFHTILERVANELGPAHAEELYIRAVSRMGHSESTSSLIEVAMNKRDASITQRGKVMESSLDDVAAADAALKGGTKDPQVLAKQLELEKKAFTDASDRLKGARKDLKVKGYERSAAKKAGKADELAKLEAEFDDLGKEVVAASDELRATRQAHKQTQWSHRLSLDSAADDGRALKAEKARATIKDTRKSVEETLAARKAQEASLEALVAEEKALTKAVAAGDSSLLKKRDAAAKAVKKSQKEVKRLKKTMRNLRKQLTKAQKAKRKYTGGTAREAIQDYSIKADEHIGTFAILEDMKAIKASLKLAEQSFQKVKLERVGDELPVDELSTAFQEAAERLARVMRNPYKYSREEYTEAVERIQELTLQAGRHKTTSVNELLDANIALLETQASRQMEALEALGARGNVDFTDALKAHKILTGAITESAAATAGHRGALTMSTVLREMGTTYDKFAKHAHKTATPAERAMVSNIQKMGWQSSSAGLAKRLDRRAMQLAHALHGAGKGGGASAVYSVMERHMRPIFKGLADAADPGSKAFGTTSQEAQQIAKAAESLQSLAADEVIKYAATRAEEARKALPEGDMDKITRQSNYDSVVDWVDDYDPDNSLVKSALDGSFWDSAKPILRAVAGTMSTSAGRAPSETEKLFSSIALAWVDTGSTKGMLTPEDLDRIRNAVRKELLTNKDITFRELMQRTRKITRDVENKRRISSKLPDVEVPPDSARAAAYAVRGVLEAESIHKASNDLMSLGGKVPKAVMDGLISIDKNDPAGAGAVMEMASIFADRLGMPTILKKQTDSLGKELRGGFAVLEDPDNATRFFIPRRWLQRLDEKSGIIVKTGDMYAADTSDQLASLASKTMSNYALMWNAAILSGLALPNPRYFINILAGNMGQVYTEMGALQAAKAGLNSAADLVDGGVRHLPFVGQRAADVISPMLVRAQESLPSAVGSFLAPSVSKFFDPALGKAHELIRPAGVGGKAYTWGQARKLAIEQGVMDSFAKTSGLTELAARTTDSAFIKALKKYPGTWARMAEAIEQRQRVSLFLDQLINQGVDPAQAGLKTRDSLYDWAHPLSAVEEQWFKRIFMFWTFQRKSLGQATRHLLSPFSKEYAGKLDNPMSRAIKTQRAMSGAQRMQTQLNRDEYGDPYSTVYPWWMSGSGSRSGMGTRELSPEGYNALRQRTGKDHTHISYSVPTPTVIESMNLIWSGLGAMGMLATGAATQDPADIKAGMDQATKTLGSLAGPMTEEMVSAMRERAGFEKKYGTSSKGRPVYNSFDQAMLRHLGEGHYDPSDGKWYVNEGAYDFYRVALPMVSVNIGGNVEPFLTSSMSDNPMGHVLRQVSGIFKEHSHNPRKTLERDRDEITKDLVKQYDAQKFRVDAPR